MKRILLSALAGIALTFSACSSDSDSESTGVKARINGENITFNTVSVIEEPHTDEGFSYVDLRVTASVNSDPSKRISFVIEQGVTGTEASWFFAYFLDETFHPKMDGFNMNVTTNNGTQLKGTFSGHVQADVEPFEIITVDNGTFNITY